QADVALQPWPAQVEPPVPEAQGLVDVLLVELERKRRAAGDDLQRVDLQLHLPRGQFGVHGAGRARDHLAGDPQDELVADLVGGRVRLRRVLRVDDELADPGPVAQVDEDEAPMVAPGVDPAGQDQRPADVLGADLAAQEIAPLHAVTPARSVPASTTTTFFAPSRPAWVCCPLTERPAKSVSARTPAARSSTSFASTAARSAPSATTKKTSMPSSAGGGVPASSSASSRRSIPAPKPTAGVWAPP